MDVLTGFLFQVFDAPMDPDMFIKGNDVVIDRVFDHPLLVENIIFHHTYKFFFGIFASPLMFQQRNRSDILASPCFELLHMFGSPKAADYPTYINSIKEQTKTRDFKKMYVYTKLAERAGIHFDRSIMTQNALIFFVNNHAAIAHSQNTLSNPITNKRAMGGVAGSTLDAIMSDKQFILKLLQRSVIAVDCPMPVHILNALIKLYSSSPPLVLDLSRSLNPDQVATFCYSTTPELYNMLPVLSDTFILISDARHPPYKSLSQNRQRSFYYMRAWSYTLDLRDNLPTFAGQYHRTLTSILTSPPHEDSTIYRVYDILDVFPRSPLSTNAQSHVLMGKHSKLPDGDAATESRRVTVFSAGATASTTGVTHIVDTAGEIPVDMLYTLAIKNNIPAKHITAQTPMSSSIYCAPLFSAAMFTKVWKAHLDSNQQKPNNVITYYEFLYSYFNNVSPPQASFSITPTKTTIALIDNRENPLSVISIIIALYNIRSPMTCHLFTSTQAFAYYAKYLSHLNVKVLQYPALDTSHFDIDVYNTILKSAQFWKTLQATGAKKIIIIQDDGIMARPGVEDLIEPWDYIGAPWADAPGNEYIRDNITRDLVGNGGFSARDIAKCLLITEKYEEEKHQLFYQNLVEIPEDVYFVAGMKKEGYKIAPRDIAAHFSSEQTLDPRAIGFHKPWAYFDQSTVKAFLAGYLGGAAFGGMSGMKGKISTIKGALHE
jgi:hypothetical protein